MALGRIVADILASSSDLIPLDTTLSKYPLTSRVHSLMNGVFAPNTKMMPNSFSPKRIGNAWTRRLDGISKEKGWAFLGFLSKAIRNIFLIEASCFASEACQTTEEYRALCSIARSFRLNLCAITQNVSGRSDSSADGIFLSVGSFRIYSKSSLSVAIRTPRLSQKVQKIFYIHPGHIGPSSQPNNRK